jgi:hypothetical protein
MAKMLFTPVHRILNDLIMEVENGKLGLPHEQAALEYGHDWRRCAGRRIKADGW